jgi:hypothetical protein
MTATRDEGSSAGLLRRQFRASAEPCRPPPLRTGWGHERFTSRRQSAAPQGKIMDPQAGQMLHWRTAQRANAAARE